MRAQKRSNSRRGSMWLLSELEELGKSPDSVLALRNGRTIREVVAMREHLRIALETGPRRWTMNEIRLLGTMNDYELGRRLRRPHLEIRRQRKAFCIPPFKPRAKFRDWKPSELRNALAGAAILRIRLLKRRAFHAGGVKLSELIYSKNQKL